MRFFETHDLLITPAASVPPFPHEDVHPREMDGRPLEGYLDWEAIAWGVTLTQCPATVIPCGRDAAGLPFGLQLVGPHGSDGWLLDVAHTLETAFRGDATLARPVPDIARLAAMRPPVCWRWCRIAGVQGSPSPQDPESPCGSKGPFHVAINLNSCLGRLAPIPHGPAPGLNGGHGQEPQPCHRPS